MARYIARVIRALIVSSLGFGGGIALLILIVALVFTGNNQAFRFAVIIGGSIGLAFAVLLLAVMLPLDLTAKLFLSKGKYKELWELEQTRDLMIDGNIKQVMAKCRQALLALPNVKQVRDDSENLLIHATIGPSWRSSGEVIELEINPIAEERWQLKCTSRCASPNVVFDYGKNYENVEFWLNKMSASGGPGN